METGIVIKSTGSWYTVKNEEGNTLNCKIRGKLRMDGIKSTNPVAVGDIVEFEYLPDENIGIIKEIVDRKNYIIRKSSNLSKQSHIIAANVDQAILMITLVFPKTTTLFIDRFLVTAEAYRIPTIIIINKTDLYDKKLQLKNAELLKIYEDAGYLCLETSVIKQTNFEKIKQIFKNKTSVIAGNSGVGKSSLINALDPKINLKIDKISDYHKTGKHTTTFAEMFEFEFGGNIIDTPGIKGFGLIDMDNEEIYHFFPEIFKESKNCKYYNCLHIHEPGCAIIKAIEEGMISKSRYNNYLSIMLNDEQKYRM